MPRILFLCAAWAALSSTAAAEPTLTPTETLIQLNVQPMPQPKPALRYLLLPELKEMEPGNPIANYLRCLLDQDLSSSFENLRASALRQADRAARMDKPDWQILLKSKTDGISLLLPDVQKMRTLAGALQERLRTEINQCHFNDAVRTAKTMFAMSRHMGENPTLIGDLVGIAIATLTIIPLEEMLAKPGCPNLYWALTNLPSPLVPMEKGWEGERLLIAAELRLLDDNAPMSTQQLDKLIAHIDFLRGFDDMKPKKSTRAWLKERKKDEKFLQEARHRLVEVGFSEERLARFPADQVLLLDEKREYEVTRDEALKLMNLRTWQVEALSRQIKPRKKESLFAFLVPAFMKVRQAQGRLEQRIALLRHVEALRLYAAEHEGKLPDKMSDCPVPLPEDPFTGKPFRYRKEADKAHLFGTPPRGLESNAAYNLHYEITIHKAAD